MGLLETLTKVTGTAHDNSYVAYGVLSVNGPKSFK